MAGVPTFHSSALQVLGGVAGGYNPYMNAASQMAYMPGDLRALIAAQTNAIAKARPETDIDRRCRIIGERIAKLETKWADKIAALHEQDKAFKVELV